MPNDEDPQSMTNERWAPDRIDELIDKAATGVVIIMGWLYLAVVTIFDITALIFIHVRDFLQDEGLEGIRRVFFGGLTFILWAIVIFYVLKQIF